jgi:hypothetical protein
MIAFHSCTKNDITPAIENNLEFYEVKMDHLAKYFSEKFYVDHELRENLFKLMEENYTGEPTMLFNRIKEEDNIGKVLKKNEEIFNSFEILKARFPKLQFCMPVQFDKWNATETILIGFVPLKEESEIKYIKAYDFRGNIILLDAHEKPEFPVILISLNERIDNEGNVIYYETEFDESQYSFKTSCTTHMINIKQMKVNDLEEPWYKGAAEIAVEVKHMNDYGSANIYEREVRANFNAQQDEKGIWSNNWDEKVSNAKLIPVESSTASGTGFVLFWFESDDGLINLSGMKTQTVTYNSKTYYFETLGTDDLMGSSYVEYNDVPTTGYKQYNTSHLYARLYTEECAY